MKKENNNRIKIFLGAVVIIAATYLSATSTNLWRPLSNIVLGVIIVAIIFGAFTKPRKQKKFKTFKY